MSALRKIMGQQLRRDCWAIICLSLLISGSVSSALGAETKDPYTLLEKAERFAMLYNWPRAGPLFAEAETLLAQRGDAKNALYARFGRIRGSMGHKPVSAVYESLVKASANALLQSDPRLSLRASVVTADMDHEFDPLSAREFNATAARKDWESVLAAGKTLGDKLWESRANGEIVLIGFIEGDLAKSPRVGVALWASESLGDSGGELRFRVAIGTGLIEAGRYEDALGYFSKALELAEENPDIGFYFPAYVGKTLTLLAQHKRDEAKQLAELCLVQARREKSLIKEALAWMLMGKACLALTDSENAIQYLEKAGALGIELGYHRVISSAWLDLAMLYRRRGNLQRAEEHLATGFRSSLRTSNKFEILTYLIALAEVKASRGKSMEAATLYDEANDKLNGILVNIPSAHARAFLIAKMSQPYLGYYNLLVASLKDLNKAFYILEQARGRSIADSLQGRDDLKEKQTTQNPFEAELTKLQAQLWFERRPEQRKELLDQIDEISRKMGPSREGGRHSVKAILFKPVELAKLQTSLYPNELVIEYVLQEPLSSCLVIGQKQVKSYSLPGRQQIEELIARYRDEIKLEKTGVEIAKQLYNWLLGRIPDLEKHPRMTIVSDGNLHLLPFESLVNPQGDYVIASHLVDYVPSATVLYLMRNQTPDETAKLSFLGVGDVVPGQRKSPPGTGFDSAENPQSNVRGFYDLEGAELQPLPGTRTEIMTISAVIGKSSVRLVGDDATEVAVKAQPLSDFKVLHFAVHGLSNDRFPGRSALVLGLDPELTQDGVFQAWEISRLHLKADLVVLSACDTGVGQLLGVEGASNLVRSFLFAGAKTVVASLWSADDRSTTALMKQFYAYLVQGMDKGSALRQAKLDLIRKYQDKAIPFHWAGFTMTGESSNPIVFGN